MKVLLAGASGAIGTPLIRQLHDAGHEVLAIHRAAAGAERLRSSFYPHSVPFPRVGWTGDLH